jgi:hypothetical protein
MLTQLDDCVKRGVIALHDRWAPDYRARITEVAIGPSGIYVIDVKRYESTAVEKDQPGSGVKRRSPRLLVSERERTDLVSKIAWQMGIVRCALDGLSEARGAAGQPMLALVGAKWGPLHSEIDIDGVFVASPEKIAKVVSRPGTLSKSAVQRIAHRLAAELPPS